MQPCFWSSMQVKDGRQGGSNSSSGKTQDVQDRPPGHSRTTASWDCPPWSTTMVLPQCAKAQATDHGRGRVLSPTPHWRHLPLEFWIPRRPCSGEPPSPGPSALEDQSHILEEGLSPQGMGGLLAMHLNTAFSVAPPVLGWVGMDAEAPRSHGHSCLWL